MNKIKASKNVRPNEKKNRKEWPVVVYFWTFGLGALGYILASMGLLHLPHSYHWMTGIIGAAIGMLIGWIWYHWRGDVI